MSPPTLAHRLVEALDPNRGDLVLVANAADGQLLSALTPGYYGPDYFYVVHWSESNEEMRGEYLLGKGFPEIPRVGRTFIEEFPTDQDLRYNGILIGLPADYTTTAPLLRISHDIGYLRRCYDWIAPYGRVVGLCTEEVFTSRDPAAVGFRWWLSEQQAETEPIEPVGGEGGIAARLVIIDK